MSKENKRDQELQDFIDYRKLVIDGMTYSVQRVDILIIALCTSGIFLTTATLKDDKCSTLLKLALIFYVASILVNLTSQFISYYANRKLVEVYNDKIVDFKASEKRFNESKYLKKENYAHWLGSLVQWLNILSFFLLIAGMIISLSYYL